MLRKETTVRGNMTTRQEKITLPRKIGELTVRSLFDGFFRLDGGSMFGIVPKPVWSRVFPADRRNRILLAMRPLLVCGPGFNLLVDVGIGRKKEQAWKDFYKIDRSGGGLEKALRRLKLAPDDITDVVLTHLHFDHAGGLTYETEDGKLQLTFPAAVHHVRREHWEWAQHPPVREAGSFIARDIEFIGKSAKLNLLDTDAEIRPAVRAVHTGGHAPGHQVVLVGNPGPVQTLATKSCAPPSQHVNSSVEVVVFCGDLIPTAAHIRLPYVMAYDYDPNGTLEQKRHLLSRAASEGWLLALEHDPRIVAVSVKSGKKGVEVARVERL